MCDCLFCSNAKIINPEACKACLESQINESTMKLAQEIQNKKLAQEIQNDFIFMKRSMTNA